MFAIIVLYLVFIMYLVYAWSAGRYTWILTNGSRILMVLLSLLALVAGIIQTVMYCR
jgi:succinate dehydrogenase hydrophobic anchor subunit